MQRYLERERSSWLHRRVDDCKFLNHGGDAGQQVAARSCAECRILSILWKSWRTRRWWWWTSQAVERGEEEVDVAWMGFWRGLWVDQPVPAVRLLLGQRRIRSHHELEAIPTRSWPLYGYAASVTFDWSCRRLKTVSANFRGVTWSRLANPSFNPRQWHAQEPPSLFRLVCTFTLRHASVRLRSFVHLQLLRFGSPQPLLSLFGARQFLTQLHCCRSISGRSKVSSFANRRILASVRCFLNWRDLMSGACNVERRLQTVPIMAFSLHLLKYHRRQTDRLLNWRTAHPLAAPAFSKTFKAEPDPWSLSTSRCTKRSLDAKPATEESFVGH